MAFVPERQADSSQARSAWLWSLDISKGGFQGAARSVAKAIGEEESKKINETQRKAKQLGGMTRHVKGGRPGRQARSRAQGSIGVPPVFPIGVRDDDQKLAGRTSHRSHSPICSLHSATQARRLCYHR